MRNACQRCIVCVMHTPTDTGPQLSGSVASEIRAEMARRGITQSTLADKLGKPQQWVWRRLNSASRQPISLDDLAVIAQALDVEPAELIKRALGAVPA